MLWVMSRIEPKVPVNFRTSVQAREVLDELAHEHRVDRTQVIVAALNVAMRHPEELAKKIEESK